MSCPVKSEDIKIITANDIPLKKIPSEIELTASDVKEEPKKNLVEYLGSKIPGFGLFCAGLGVFAFSCQMIIVKYLTDVHSIELFVFRSLVQLIFFGTWSFCQKYSIIGKPGQRLNLVLRGVFGATSALTIFYAFRLIPLGDAATLQYTSPIFVVLVARVMINEPIKLIQILTGVMSVAGAFIISRPEFAFGSNNSSQSVSSADRILGSALGIGSALAMAFATIFIRKLRDVAVPVVIIWFSIVSIPMGLIILVSLKALTVPKLWPHGPLILAMGACGITDQVLLTTALRFEKAGPVAVVRTLIIFLAFVWDILLFSVAIHWTSITGAFLVLSSVMVLALVKMNEENPHLFTCCKFWRNKKANLNDSEINDKSRNSMEEESGIGESYTTVSTISMSHVKQEN